jgi:DNA-binding transcriptional regulator YiaG
MKIFEDVKVIKKTLAEILDINKQAFKMTLENRELLNAHLGQQIRIGAIVEAELLKKAKKSGKKGSVKPKKEKKLKVLKKKKKTYRNYAIPSKEIADKVKLFRKSTGRSQTQFGELFGMNQGEVSGLERRIKGLKKLHIQRLENFFAQG